MATLGILRYREQRRAVPSASATADRLSEVGIVISRYAALAGQVDDSE